MSIYEIKPYNAVLGIFFLLIILTSVKSLILKGNRFSERVSYIFETFNILKKFI